MRYVVMTMLMILTGFDLSLAQGSKEQRESLRELEGVFVVVDTVESDAQADGLSRQEIYTATELVLRSAGIHIIEEPVSLLPPHQPVLYVRVSTYRHPAGMYAFTLTVEFEQYVSIWMQPEDKMWAPTWRRSFTGAVTPPNIRQVLVIVEQKVKEFANDFLAVNPK